MRLAMIIFAFTCTAVAQVEIGSGRQPQVATGSNHVSLTFGRDHEIWIADSTDAGKTFAAPIKIATGTFPLGMRRGPRIAIAKSACIITDVRDGNVIAWRSDSPNHWTEIPVSRSPNSAREGFNALAADGNDRVFCVWLDDRNGGKEIWGALSTNAGRSFEKDFRIYASPAGHVCECCHPSVIFTPAGDIAVMFRNFDGQHRDLYLTQFQDGQIFSPAQKLGVGTWTLNACPMDGGSLVATTDTIHTIWRRESQIFSAIPGENEIDLGPGTQPVVAIVNDAPFYLWLSKRAGDLLMQQGNNAPTTLAHNATDPSIAALPDHKSAIVAWESENRIFTKVLP